MHIRFLNKGNIEGKEKIIKDGNSREKQHADNSWKIKQRNQRKKFGEELEKDYVEVCSLYAHYRFNVIPIKLPIAFFTKQKQKISQFVWKHKRP